MKGSSLLSIGLVALSALPSLGIKLPILKRDVHSSHGFSAAMRYPTQRAGDDPDAIDLMNGGNLLYLTNVTIAGQNITVQIDTGSTDLWVLPETPLKNLKLSNAGVVNLTYGTGSAKGPIAFAPFSFGNYSVKSQGDVCKCDVGARGIFGLSFNGLRTSPITNAVAIANHNDTVLGQNAIANIFMQDPELPNFFSILLGREGDQGEEADGAFTISEYLEGLEHIAKSPRQPRVVPGGDLDLARWAVIVEGISINGTKLALNSSSKGVPKGQAVAVLDTGATNALVPKYISDFIYGSIPGAIFSEQTNIWAVPCTSTADVRLVLGGQEIAINPLDLTLPMTVSLSDNTTRTLCGGTYQPNALDPTGFSGFDMLLGDAFLRNVYALFDYGVSDSKGNVIKNPFIQLLPLTNPVKDGTEFFKNRLHTLSQSPPEATPEEIRQLLGDSSAGGTSSPDTSSSSGASSSLDKSVGNAVTTSDSGDSSLSTLVSRMDQWSPVIVGLLAGNLVVGIVICILALSMCVRRGATSVGTRARTASPSYVPVRFKEDSALREEEVLAARYSD
ncbi:aspartic peptidase [Heterobasidion irregulare TC 32-1]|uniref:Aspartic peptidase n=1 Tax=Heterobasidion irregulare (strain TC 32-1) TaxID=747525 RepID=W4KAQ1_HETIT|nr:aspartic peptidase [Heterobasidion irregulare TC 32-1]ETW82863.1 aspartic peptidase [Heterobasidion irregulare TC 32-1]